MTIPVSVVVLTYNSEADIGPCLASVAGWVDEMFIVDSFSEDATAEIAKGHGAGVHAHRFEGFAAQRNWALDHLPFRQEWVFFLDADEVVLPELRAELCEVFGRGDPKEAGFYVPRRFVWMGRWLRHGGYYPAAELQLVRRRRCRVIDAGLREYQAVEGDVGRLHHDLLHEARKGLGYWIQKHVMYAEREAHEFVTGEGRARLRAAQRPGVYLEGVGRNRFRENVWNRLPPFTRPVVLFGYRYVVKAGFRDGVPGLVYCFLHELWYQFMIDLRVWELRGTVRKVTEESSPRR